MAEHYGYIFVIDDIEKLREAITGYGKLVKAMPERRESNNAEFNTELQRIVEEMF